MGMAARIVVAVVLALVLAPAFDPAPRAAVDISIREIGLAHVCKRGSLDGSVCDHLDPNACPDGECVLKLGIGPKFRGVLTVVSQDNPTNFWGDAFNAPSISVTLQLKGRFGLVKNPILAATFQPNDIPNNVLNYPPGSLRESQTMDESTIVQLPTTGGILSRPFTFNGQLETLFGVTGRPPIIVGFTKPVVTDNSGNEAPSVFSAKVFGVFMDPN
jgi:hypothetical protein